MDSKIKLSDLAGMRDKGVSKTAGSAGILSRLFRQMMLDLNISPLKIHELMQAYILDPRNGVPNNRRDQISERGNLTKELARPQMTWKIFCKSLRFIGIRKVRLTLVATHANGVETTHGTFIDFGSRRDTEEFNKSLNQPEDQEATIHVEALDGMDEKQ